MTRDQVQNLCAELGMKIIDFRNRIIYRNYVVGNYYYDIDCVSYKISFIGSCVNTKNYETARKEAIRKTKEIKDYIANKKLKTISEDF
jgi:hypothetical protein